ncbi:YjbF family lipoprotein [Acidimangrovimonas pyrenivorans]|uniref:YjbF family lipoprotein n=1 Tax=Acidimangrovimonas pyrenivorans TaxID=2030798 RepID=A0ABV7AD66_9RHOB
MTAKAMRAALALLAAASLAGCGSDLGGQQQAGALKAVIGARAKVGPTHLSRAQIRAAGEPLLLAESRAKHLRAYLTRLGTNGAVVTWVSRDDRTVSLGDGLLVQTRGLGEDLMSAAPPSLAALRRGRGTVAATYYFLDGNDQSYAVPVTCRLTDNGHETLTIAERPYRLHHVSARCRGGSVGFTNDYWFDTRGRLRTSRQWISPSLGVFAFTDLAP